jgi:hypothetical protein
MFESIFGWILQISLPMLFITWFLLMEKTKEKQDLEKENERLRRQLGINDFD